MNPYYVESMGEQDREAVVELLERNQLALEATVDYTAVLKHHGSLVGTCSYEKNVLKSFAIQPCYQGGGGAMQLLTHIVNHLFDAGHFTVLAFTYSHNRTIFEAMHFRSIYDTGKVALLSAGIHDFDLYLRRMAQRIGPSSGSRSGIVMNGNPFTKGHLHLIERASSESGDVIVFVVEENKSLFPFEKRLDLIRQGTRHLSNVKVVPSGAYMVSMATFPSYFVRDASERAKRSAELDAGIFSACIAPALQISRRYVGTEPYCAMTAQYNDALKSVLSKNGMELCIVERKVEDGYPISASEVRRLLANARWDEVERIVPPTTLKFLKSDDALEILKKLQQKERPH